MKKILMSVTIMIVLVLLPGCCVRHEWQEATCINPKTCEKCGKTEGTTLNHKWKEATCDMPQVCSVCGKTKGEALGHVWTDANYQKPYTCKVCGETVGVPLQADFEKCKININTQLNTPYKVVTPCLENKDYSTVGEVVFSDFEVFPMDDTHEGLEGYEWRTIKATESFMDDNAKKYGVKIWNIFADYYFAEAWFMDNNERYTLNYNGKDYTECIRKQEIAKNWHDEAGSYTELQWSFRVPIGYDGVIVIYNEKADSATPLEAASDKESVMFRLK